MNKQYKILLLIGCICLLVGIYFVGNSKVRFKKIDQEYLFMKKNPIEYWIKRYKDKNEVILTEAEIEEFNKKIIERQTLNAVDPKAKNYDLIEYPEVVSKNLIINAAKYSSLYEAIPEEEYYNFDSLKEINKVRYALAINRSSLRSIPTEIRFFERKDDIHHFDIARYKEIKYGEPMVVLHETLDNNWLLVQTNNTKGWIKAKDVAFTTKENFKKYINVSDFVVIISKSIDLDGIYVDMGVKLSLSKEDEDFYYVNCPTKDANNNLVFKTKKIKKSDDLHRGYIPYTTLNFMKQVMKYYETPYGWGGIDNGVDCSGLVFNVYSVFGFVFPRNSSKQQSMAGNIFKFDGRNNKEILDKLMPGSLLFFPGHIMIYLGKIGNRYYIIHALGIMSNKDREKIKVMSVEISDLAKTLRASGIVFLKDLRTATEIR